MHLSDFGQFIFCVLVLLLLSLLSENEVCKNSSSNMAVLPHEGIIIADRYNHRIQVFTPEGKLLRMWGKRGTKPGEFKYPHDIVILPYDFSYEILIADTGNHRVQVFTPEGKFLRMWETQIKEFDHSCNVTSLIPGQVINVDEHNHCAHTFHALPN